MESANNYCKTCGTHTDSTAIFCHMCGEKLQGHNKPNKKKKYLSIIITVFTILVIGLPAAWIINKQSQLKHFTENIKPGEHKVGEKFQLANGKSFKVASAQITDKIDGERQLIIRVEYDNPNLDQLAITLTNNGEKVTDQRYNQPGVLEYKGLYRGLARAGYSLNFEDGNSVKLTEIAYSEIPNNTPLGKGLELLTTPSPSPANNNNTNSSSSNLQCNTYDYGYSTSTNCYTY